MRVVHSSLTSFVAQLKPTGSEGKTSLLSFYSVYHSYYTHKMTTLSCYTNAQFMLNSRVDRIMTQFCTSDGYITALILRLTMPPMCTPHSPLFPIIRGLDLGTPLLLVPFANLQRTFFSVQQSRSN